MKIHKFLRDLVARPMNQQMIKPSDNHNLLGRNNEGNNARTQFLLSNAHGHNSSTGDTYG